MKITDYDQALLIAENDISALYISKWGKSYRYCFLDKDTGDASQVGDFYENKTQYITNAFDYATKIWGFEDSQILDKYPRNSIVTVNISEKAAINTAIRLLSSSNSDHADQCLCYLKSLSLKF